MSKALNATLRQYAVEGWQPLPLPGLPEEAGIAYLRANPPAARYPWAYKVFKGAAGKPWKHFAARSEDEARTQALKWLEEVRAIAQRVADAKASEKARKAALTVETLPVGTILAHTYGYDETHQEFYKVLAHAGRVHAIVGRVPAVPCPSAYKEMTMAGYVVPDVEAEPSGAIRATLSSDGALVKGRTRMRKWDGKPCYVSWYA